MENGVGRRDGRWSGDERPCWLDIDLDAVRANVRAIRALVGPATRICAVVKAEAYGLGAVAVSRAVLDSGGDWLAVARLEEGVRLRQAGLTAPILMVGGFAPNEATQIVRNELTPTVVHAEDALALGRAAGRAGAVLPVHLKVDTGLTRFGARPFEALNLARLLTSLPTLHLQGLYTHFAAADEPDQAFTDLQLAHFESVRVTLAAEGITPDIVHAANSAATLAKPSARLHLVRVGIMLSGHYPSEHVPRAVQLHPAVSLRARLLRVDTLDPAATIGYGRTFRATRPMRVGLVPLGYADGVPRAHSNRAFALANGARARLVGRVSMDQCVVDLTDVQDVRRGDEVTLFGASGPERIGLDEYAAWSDTIGHEALCRVGARVPRRYREAGQARWAGADESVSGVRPAPSGGTPDSASGSGEPLTTPDTRNGSRSGSRPEPWLSPS